MWQKDINRTNDFSWLPKYHVVDSQYSCQREQFTTVVPQQIIYLCSCKLPSNRINIYFTCYIVINIFFLILRTSSESFPPHIASLLPNWSASFLSCYARALVHSRLERLQYLLASGEVSLRSYQWRQRQVTKKRKRSKPCNMW